MNCIKCGKEIPEGDKKICDECQSKLLQELEEENLSPKAEEPEKSKIEESKKEEIKNPEEKKKLNKKIVISIIIAIVILFLIGIFVLFRGNLPFMNNKVGNTIGNIKDYGYTAKQGEWVYYVAPDEKAEKSAIYKSKVDGSKKEMLLCEDWDFLSLNVVGNYIYFIAITDEEIETSTALSIGNEDLDTLNNVIYRMKLDGSELEAINKNEFHNNCYQIFVVKDKIYYIGLDTNIYYMDLDGSNKTKLNDDQTGFLGITEDYIILNTKKEGTTPAEYITSIMNLDGTNKHELTGERLYNVNIVDDYVYYLDKEEHVYKVKIDGTENSLVTDQYSCYNLNVDNKKIYYMSYTSEEKNKIAIYKMDLDGSNNEVVYELDNYSSYLNIVDGNAVFMDNNSQSGSINLVDKNKNIVKLYELLLEEQPQSLVQTPEETASSEN